MEKKFGQFKDNAQAIRKVNGIHSKCHHLMVLNHILMVLFRRNILQMIAIQRRDNGMWAIPGGMVDPSEKICATLKREFIEETLHKSNSSTEKIIDAFFNENSTEIYSGYVDDPRNTDNSWMETTACHFHDDTVHVLNSLKFKAGSDAKHVKWLDIDRNMNLYANHKDFVERVAAGLNAHW